MGTNGRPSHSRFRITRANSSTIGVADGSIIATIITVHMTNMKTTSFRLQDWVLGMATLAAMALMLIEPMPAASRTV